MTMKWRHMLLPIIGAGVVVLFVVAKLRHTYEGDGVEMTDERKRLLIVAERHHKESVGEEL